MRSISYNADYKNNIKGKGSCQA